MPHARSRQLRRGAMPHTPPPCPTRRNTPTRAAHAPPCPTHSSRADLRGAGVSLRCSLPTGLVATLADPSVRTSIAATARRVGCTGPGPTFTPPDHRLGLAWRGPLTIRLAGLAPTPPGRWALRDPSPDPMGLAGEARPQDAVETRFGMTPTAVNPHDHVRERRISPPALWNIRRSPCIRAGRPRLRVWRPGCRLAPESRHALTSTLDACLISACHTLRASGATTPSSPSILKSLSKNVVDSDLGPFCFGRRAPSPRLGVQRRGLNPK
jgi:hypothetical protein